MKAPAWLSWMEVPFHIPNPKTGQNLPEAAGWAMDSAGRGPLNLVGSYVGGAVLRMAIKEAGGPNNTVRGLLKPSSLLTAASSIVGVIAALLMPVCGAIIDHTHHRRMMGIVSGVFAVGLVGVQISISLKRNNWFFILIIDMLQSFSLLVHTTAIFAYLPDLSLDEEVTSHYTARIFVRQYVASFIVVCCVIIANEVRNIQNPLEATVQTARDGASICFTWGSVLTGYAWVFLMRDRPALSQVPEDSNLLSTGFLQVYRTASKIWSKYRALKWFMISLLWSPEAGAGVVLSIVITYLTIVMEFTGDDIAKGLLIYLVGTVVGSYFSKVMCRAVNPLNSYRLGMTTLGVSVGVATFLFTGPERRASVFGLCTAWGFCQGWAYPSQRVLFCTLIPKGQETEMMGLFTFTGQILGWLPPFVVTLMNENDVDIKWSTFVVLGFCIFAVVLTLPMGNYQKACEVVARDSEAKLKSIKEHIPGSTVKKDIELSSSPLSAIKLGDNTKDASENGSRERVRREFFDPLHPCSSSISHYELNELESNIVACPSYSCPNKMHNNCSSLHFFGS